MGKHRDSLKQRSIFTWQHCRYLQQQGSSVRPSWATAFRVEKTALLLKITTKPETPGMVENPRKLRKQQNRQITEKSNLREKQTKRQKWLKEKSEKRDETQKKFGQKESSILEKQVSRKMQD